MSDASSSSGGGIGLGGLTFLVLLVLKIFGVITWSWWWVTAPLWISAMFVLVILTAMFAVAIVLRD